MSWVKSRIKLITFAKHLSTIESLETMPLHMPKLEQQLKNAQDALNAYVAKLEGQNVDKAKRKSDPQYRTLNSTCSQIRSRIKSAQATLDREAECASKKADDSE